MPKVGLWARGLGGEALLRGRRGLESATAADRPLTAQRSCPPTACVPKAPLWERDGKPVSRVPATPAFPLKPPSRHPETPAFSVKPPSSAPRTPAFPVKPPSSAPRTPTFPVKPPSSAPRTPTFSVNPPSSAPRTPTFFVKPPSSAPRTPAFPLKPPSRLPETPAFSLKPPSRVPAGPVSAAMSVLRVPAGLLSPAISVLRVPAGPLSPSISVLRVPAGPLSPAISAPRVPPSPRNGVAPRSVRSQSPTLGTRCNPRSRLAKPHPTKPPSPHVCPPGTHRVRRDGFVQFRVSRCYRLVKTYWPYIWMFTVFHLLLSIFAPAFLVGYILSGFDSGTASTSGQHAATLFLFALHWPATTILRILTIGLGLAAPISGVASFFALPLNSLLWAFITWWLLQLATHAFQHYARKPIPNDRNG